MSIRYSSVAVLFWFLVVPSLSAQEGQDAELANRAYGVLKQHCHRCHGVNFEAYGFNVLDRDGLLKEHPDQDAYVVPGEAAKSLMWKRAGIDGDMPPSKVKDRPSPEDLATIQAWINAGAPKWTPASTRTHKSEDWVLRRIHRYLDDVDVDAQRHYRFFSLVHLYNNSTVTDDELRVQRAAFVKLLNSLTREGKDVRVTLIDASEENPYDGLIFRVDLRDLGWDLEQWRKLIRSYPYGVEWNDPALADLTRKIGKLLGTSFEGVPYYRTDWMLTNASRPPHYNNLLGLPTTVQQLEADLKVDVIDDFKQDRVIRAGFAGSGVSKHNRLVDRHEGSNTSYYYRSYDFGKSSGKGVLFRFPLGPKFDANPFDQHAFEHDGGEIIWRLPNGMQAYLLIDNEGKSIPEGPVNIVRDLNEHGGTPLVTNGISCMGCHRHGILDYRDTIRGGLALTGEARRKVDRLYSKTEEIERLLARDKQDFLRSLDRITGNYLKQADDANKRIEEFPEVISASARYYAKDVGIGEVIAELGLESIADFPIRGNAKLQELGLGPLEKSGTIPRAMWDTLDDSDASLFHQSIVALGLGRGVNPR